MQNIDTKTYSSPVSFKLRAKCKQHVISSLNHLASKDPKQEPEIFDEERDTIPSNLNEKSKKITKLNKMQEKTERIKLKRQVWTPEEDEKLLRLFETNKNNWTVIAFSLKNRTGKQVRDRYQNYLRPNIRTDAFTAQEDNIIISLYNQLGTKWSKICSCLSGRSELQVKNRFYAVLKKKLPHLPENQQNIPLDMQKSVSITKEAENELQCEEEDRTDSEEDEESGIKLKEEPCVMQKIEDYNTSQQIITDQNSMLKLETELKIKEESDSGSFVPSSGIFDSTETNSEDYQAENTNVPFQPNQPNILQSFSYPMSNFMRSSDQKLTGPILPFMGNPYIKTGDVTREPLLSLQQAIIDRQRELLIRKKKAVELYYQTILQQLNSLDKMKISMEVQK